MTDTQRLVCHIPLFVSKRCWKFLTPKNFDSLNLCTNERSQSSSSGSSVAWKNNHLLYSHTTVFTNQAVREGLYTVCQNSWYGNKSYPISTGPIGMNTVTSLCIQVGKSIVSVNFTKITWPLWRAIYTGCRKKICVAFGHIYL